MLYNKNLANLYFQVKSNKSVKINVVLFGEHSSLPHLQRLTVQNIMLLAISLLTTSRQGPLLIKTICKVYSVKGLSFYVLYAVKSIYIPRDFSCRPETVTKSSENLLLLGHLQNHHKEHGK